MTPTVPPPLLMLDANYFPHLVDEVVFASDYTTLLRLRATCTSLRDRVDRLLARRITIGARHGVETKCDGGRHSSFLPLSTANADGVTRNGTLRFGPGDGWARPLVLLKHTLSLSIEGLVPPALLSHLAPHFVSSTVVRVLPESDLIPSVPPFTSAPSLPFTPSTLVWTCDLSEGPTLSPPPHVGQVHFDVVCGPRSLYSTFHLPSADAYVVSFRGPRQPTLATASVLAFIFGEVVLPKPTEDDGKEKRWTFVDSPGLRSMLTPADYDEDSAEVDVVARRIESVLHTLVQEAPASRVKVVQAAMRRLQVVDAASYDPRAILRR